MYEIRNVLDWGVVWGHPYALCNLNENFIHRGEYQQGI